MGESRPLGRSYWTKLAVLVVVVAALELFFVVFLSWYSPHRVLTHLQETVRTPMSMAKIVAGQAEFECLHASPGCRQGSLLVPEVPAEFNWFGSPCEDTYGSFFCPFYLNLRWRTFCIESDCAREGLEVIGELSHQVGLPRWLSFVPYENFVLRVPELVVRTAEARPKAPEKRPVDRRVRRKSR